MKKPTQCQHTLTNKQFIEYLLWILCIVGGTWAGYLAGQLSMLTNH